MQNEDSNQSQSPTTLAAQVSPPCLPSCYCPFLSICFSHTHFLPIAPIPLSLHLFHTPLSLSPFPFLHPSLPHPFPSHFSFPFPSSSLSLALPLLLSFLPPSPSLLLTPALPPSLLLFPSPPSLALTCCLSPPFSATKQMHYFSLLCHSLSGVGCSVTISSTRQDLHSNGTLHILW